MSADNYIFKAAVMWFLADVIPKLRQLDFDRLKKVCDEASNVSMEHPLHQTGPNQTWLVPSFEQGREFTGCHLVAIMVGALWVAVGEDPEMCSSLYESWPISDALFLCGRVEPRKRRPDMLVQQTLKWMEGK